MAAVQIQTRAEASRGAKALVAELHKLHVGPRLPWKTQVWENRGWWHFAVSCQGVQVYKAPGTTTGGYTVYAGAPGDIGGKWAESAPTLVGAIRKVHRDAVRYVDGILLLGALRRRAHLTAAVRAERAKALTPRRRTTRRRHRRA